MKQRYAVMINGSRIIMGALGMIFLFSYCGPDQEIAVQKKVAERVSIFRKKRIQECRATLIGQAEHIVDSLLLAEARQSLSDSLTRQRPGKPLQPLPVPAIDTLAIKPIF